VDLTVMLVLLAEKLLLIVMVAGVPTVVVPFPAKIPPKSIDLLPMLLVGLPRVLLQPNSLTAF